jgi:exopolysaccharide production protein ExoZ
VITANEVKIYPPQSEHTKYMEKIISIQYLRAAAAIAVVCAHTFGGFGAEGVDLFFVISGFIMFYIIESMPEKSAKSFFLDRFFRIAPMYYLATATFVLLGYAQISSFHQVVQVITFLKYYETAPLLSIGWTLEYEFVFYSICAIAILVFKDFRLRLWFVVAALLSAVILIDFYAFSDKKYGHFAEFLFGIFIYLLYKKKIIPSDNLLLGIIGLFTSICIFFVSNMLYSDGFTYLRFIGFGIPSALLLTSTLCMRRQIGNYYSFEYLGNASYSIYITHTITLYSYYSLTGYNRGETLLSDVASFGLAVSIGCIVHSFLEIPVSKSIRRMRLLKNKNIA